MSALISFLGLFGIFINIMFLIESWDMLVPPLESWGSGWLLTVTAPRKLDGKGYSCQEAGCPSMLPSQAPKDGFNYT